MPWQYKGGCAVYFTTPQQSISNTNMVTLPLTIFIYIIDLDCTAIYIISQAHVSMHGNIGIWSIRMKTPKPSHLAITSSSSPTNPEHLPNIISITFRWWMTDTTYSLIHQILNDIRLILTGTSFLDTLYTRTWSTTKGITCLTVDFTSSRIIFVLSFASKATSNKGVLARARYCCCRIII